MSPQSDAFNDLDQARTILLTSFRRDGTPVGTPVHVAVDNGRAYIRTYDRAWKLKRIRRNPEVEIAPSTITGDVIGPPRRAKARILSGDESAGAGRRLAKKHPILHGILVPLSHRLLGMETMHLELVPVGCGHGEAACPGSPRAASDW